MGLFPNFKCIERNRNHRHGIRAKQYLSEVLDPSAILCGETAGFYPVAEDESIIFYSIHDGTYYNLYWNGLLDIYLGKPEVELIVISGVATKASIAESLYTHIYSTIQAACRERRNIRVSLSLTLYTVANLFLQPGDPGSMVQLGMNLGPRHARVLGWAKSYTRKLDDGAKADHDADAVGVVSLVWGLIEKLMPQEVLDAVQSHLDGLGLPRLATRNLEEGRVLPP